MSDALSDVARWRLIAGWTMIHYLWIGAAMTLALACGRVLLRRAAAEVRYNCCLAGLAALAAAPLAILLWLAATTGPPPGAESPVAGERPPIDLKAPVAPPDRFASEGRPQPESSTLPDGPSDGSLAGMNLTAAVDALAAQLVWLWLAGVTCLSLFTVGGMTRAQRLRRCALPCQGDVLDSLCRRLAARLGVVHPVAVAVCQRIASPMVLGIVRPLILLPPAALSGWSPEHIELVLLHELAHVRRRDNLVALAQRILETLLFFQPGVWVVSAWLRQEREHCCDLMVVAVTGRRLEYARALIATALAEPTAASSGAPAANLAASMARSHLVARVRRLVYQECEPMQFSWKISLLAAMVAATAATGIAWSQPPKPQAEPGKPEASSDAAAAEPAPVVREAAPRADDNSASSSTPIPREELVFDGKDFEHWRRAWRTELNPTRRAESIDALKAFASNGYPKEVAEAIIEGVRGYDFSSLSNESKPINSLKAKALEALDHVPADVAVPALLSELRAGTPKRRLLAVRALSMHARANEPVWNALLEIIRNPKSDPQVAALAIETTPHVQAHAAELTAALRAALKRGEASVALAALNRLVPHRGGYGMEGYGGMMGMGDDMYGGGYGGGSRGMVPGGAGYPGYEMDEAAAPGRPGVFVPEMIEAAFSDNPQVSVSAIHALQQLGDKAQPAVAPLAKAVGEGEPTRRKRALDALDTMGWRVDIDEALPAILEAAKSSEEPVRHSAIDALRRIRNPKALNEQALPALQEAYDLGDVTVKMRVLRSLSALGPRARSAATWLSDAARAERTPLQLQIQAALRAVTQEVSR